VQAAGRLRAGCRWKNHGLVFARDDGSPIRKETDSAEWHRILKIAGVRQARLHDARHTAATLLLVQGVPAGVAMRLLGRSNARVLARYHHRRPDLIDRLARFQPTIGDDAERWLHQQR
jgi:integrase